MAGIDRKLMRETRVARLHLALAVILALASAAAIVAQAVLLAHIIDRAALHGASAADLQGSLIGLAGVLASRALIAAAFELSGRLGAIAIMSELRRRLARQLLVLAPVGRNRSVRTGELAAAAVQGVDALEAYFAGYLPQAVLAGTVPFAVLAWTLGVDPIAAGLLAVTAPLVVVFMILIGKNAQAETDRRWRALSLLGSHFLDVVKGLPTLRLFRRESAQAATLADVGDRYRRETMATLRTAFLSALVLESCAMIGTALVAAAVGIQLTAGVLTLESGLVVLLLAPELFAPLRQVGQQFHAAADGTAAARRIFEVLDGPAGLASISTGTDAPDPARETVRLDGVGHGYDGRAAVLRGLEMELEPGCITALVGASGSGKSTIANLVMRLTDPETGTVLCGGADLRFVDPEAWRVQVAWLPQRPQLFAGTVRENIALASPEASEREIRHAAVAAGADEFIESLPDGLSTPVGDGGRRLSAGQVQRLAVARAFLQDPGLLVLDEPTSHLDDARAADLSEALRRLAAGRTTLLITHDAGLVAQADRVYSLEAGRVVKIGPSRPTSPRALSEAIA